MKQIELTAPAGNIQKGQFAFKYGADSVYIGFPGFSLRSKAERFDLEKLAAFIKESQKNGKKIFLALNIFAHNRSLAPFTETLSVIKTLNPDGLILSDLGLISKTRDLLPDMHITVSTQFNLTNYETINFLKKSLNINRAVLARELHIDEIKEICDNTDVEIEAFVHGAVCMSYSGRCLLSSFMTSKEWGMSHQGFGPGQSRDANSGDCVQPCRFNFALVEQNRKDFAFPIEEDQWGSYILSAKDLCLLEYLDQLKKAGVNVFKIEGRMKSIYYVANVTRVYRRAINLFEQGQTLNKELKEELEKVSHRGYSSGFTVSDDNSPHEAALDGYLKSYRLHAIVEKQEENPYYFLNVFNTITDDKELEFIGPDMRTYILKTGEYSFFDKDKNPVSSLKHQINGYIKTNQPLKNMDILRIKIE